MTYSSQDARGLEETETIVALLSSSVAMRFAALLRRGGVAEEDVMVLTAEVYRSALDILRIVFDPNTGDILRAIDEFERLEASVEEESA